MKSNSTYRNKLFWICILTLFTGLVIAARHILLPFIASFLIAYLLAPVMRYLAQKEIARGLAAGLIVGTFFLVFVFAIMLVAPTVYREISNLIESIPVYIRSLYNGFHDRLQDGLYTKILNWLSILPLDNISTYFTKTSPKLFWQVLKNTWTSSITILNLIGLFFITPVVSFYILRDWEIIAKHIVSIFPLSYRASITRQLIAIDKVINAYIRGQSYIATILTMFYSIAFTAIGLNASILLGITTGLSSFIPYIGILFSFILSILVTFMQFHYDWHILLLIGVFASGQIIDGLFITPKIIADKLALSPAWIIFSMFFWGELIGFVGVLFAMPLTAVTSAIIKSLLSQYRRSIFYK